MFGRRITLFKLLGFEVRVDASWLVIAALVTWSLAVGFFPSYYPGLSSATYLWLGLAGAILLFASIVIHELFHSLVARRYGIPMKGITLFIFGGIAEMDREPPSAKSEFLMAIAGPIASVLLGFLFYGLLQGSSATGHRELAGLFAYLAEINGALAAFNLIPAFPLDGGRVLRAALWNAWGDMRRATRVASWIGSAFAVLLMAYAVLQLFTGNFMGALWYFFIGMFLRTAAMAAYNQLIMRSALEGEPVSRFMTRNLDVVTPDESIEEVVTEHMYRYHHRLLPVVTASQELAGCVTVEEVKKVPREEWTRHRVEEIAKPCSPENTISPDADALEALKQMQETNSTRLMVVDHGRLVAVVALRDLMDFLATKLELLGEAPRLRTV